MWPAGCSKAGRQTETVEGFAVSSTASNAGISPAVAPSQRPLTPSLPQDNGAANDTSPFALLLDAAAAAPPSPQQPTGTFTIGRRAPTAGDQGGSQSTSAAATAPADPTKDPGATAAAGPSTNPPANAPQPQNPPAGQAGAPSPSDLTGNDPQFAAFLRTLAAPANNNAPVDSSTPGSTAKTPSDNGDDNQDDGSNGADAAATTAAGQPQPLAAAFVANAIVATPPTGDATTSDTTIGGSGSAKPLSPSIGAADLSTASATTGDTGATGDAQTSADGNATATQAANDPSVTQSAGNGAPAQAVKVAALTQDAALAPPISPDGKIAGPLAPNPRATAPSQNTKTTGPQPPAAADNGAAPANNDNAPVGAPADPTNAQAGNGAAVPPPQLHADGDDAAPAQSGGGTGHADGSASADAGAATTQGASNAAKPIDGVANFGFAAIAQATPTAAATAPAAAAAVNAAVPIAGLPVAIAARALDGATQFNIRLDPPELGRIAVRLDVDRDGQVTSHVTVDRADTLQLLQSQQPQLERALEQAGLKTADNGLQFTLRDQSFAGQNGQSGHGGSQANTATIVIPDADQPATPATQIYSRFARVSGIDIRV